MRTFEGTSSWWDCSLFHAFTLMLFHACDRTEQSKVWEYISVHPCENLYLPYTYTWKPWMHMMPNKQGRIRRSWDFPESVIRKTETGFQSCTVDSIYYWWMVRYIMQYSTIHCFIDPDYQLNPASRPDRHQSSQPSPDSIRDIILPVNGPYSVVNTTWVS
jgi:hypothetical protein